MAIVQVKELIEAGVAVALGSNFNPYQNPTLNMQTVIALACGRLAMTVEPAISAATINARLARAAEIPRH